MNFNNSYLNTKNKLIGKSLCWCIIFLLSMSIYQVCDSESAMPSISSISDATTNEDTVLETLNFTLSDSDSDSLTLTLASSNPGLISVGNIECLASGLVDVGDTYILSASPTPSAILLKITPSLNQNGIATITLTVTDGINTQYTSFKVTVNPVNDPPYAQSATINIVENIAISGGLVGIDVDSVSKTFSVVSQASKGTVVITNASTGSCQYTPNYRETGTDSFSFKVSDGLSDSNVGTITINIQPMGDSTVRSQYERQELWKRRLSASSGGLSITSTSILSSNYLVFGHDNQTATSIHATLTLDMDSRLARHWYIDRQNDVGTLTFTFDFNELGFSTIPYDADQYDLIYISSLNSGTIQTVSVSSRYVSGNKLVFESASSNISDGYYTLGRLSHPLVSNLDSKTTNEDGFISTTFNYEGFYAQTLSVTKASSNQGLIPNDKIAMSCSSGSCNMTITPIKNLFGISIVSVNFSDNSGLSASHDFTVTVNSVNDAPDITMPYTLAMLENTSTSIPIKLIDIDSDSLTITITTSNELLLGHSGISVTGENVIQILTDTYQLSSGYANTSISITPNEYQVGVVSISIYVSDGIETVSHPLSLTVTADRYMYAGQATFYSNAAPVSNVVMTFTGIHQSYTITTDKFGNYTATDMIPDNYSISATKTDIDGTLSSVDVSRIARYVTGLYALDCHQKIAADVTGDGYITSTDASRVARYIVGLRSTLNTNGVFWTILPVPYSQCSDWPPIRFSLTESMTLDNSHLAQQFVAIKLGEIGEWQTDYILRRNSIPDTSDTFNQEKVTIYDSITLPVVLNSDNPLEGIDIEILLDPKVFRIENISLANCLAESNYEIIYNMMPNGKLMIAIYATKNLIKVNGNLAFITLNAVTDTDINDSSVSIRQLKRTNLQNALGFSVNNSLVTTVRIASLATNDIDRDRKLTMADVLTIFKEISETENSKEYSCISKLISILQCLTSSEN